MRTAFDLAREQAQVGVDLLRRRQDAAAPDPGPSRTAKRPCPARDRGHGGSMAGRFSQAHNANVSAAKTAATDNARTLHRCSRAMVTAAPRRQCRQAASPASCEEYSRCGHRMLLRLAVAAARALLCMASPARRRRSRSRTTNSRSRRSSATWSAASSRIRSTRAIAISTPGHELRPHLQHRCGLVAPLRVPVAPEHEGGWRQAVRYGR